MSLDQSTYKDGGYDKGHPITFSHDSKFEIATSYSKVNLSANISYPVREGASGSFFLFFHVFSPLKKTLPRDIVSCRTVQRDDRGDYLAVRWLIYNLKKLPHFFPVFSPKERILAHFFPVFSEKNARENVP